MALTTQHGYPFTREGIQRFAPRCAGLYGVRSGAEWVYIGHATDIEGRLLEQVEESWDCSGFPAKASLTFSFEKCDLETGKARASQLIAELQPRRNGA